MSLALNLPTFKKLYHLLNNPVTIKTVQVVGDIKSDRKRDFANVGLLIKKIPTSWVGLFYRC